MSIALCKDLANNNLELLLIHIDKENLMEFSLDWLHYLYMLVTLTLTNVLCISF